MKYDITFEIDLQSSSTAMLSLVAGLHEVGAVPECLVWSSIPGNKEARAWVKLESEPSKHEALRAHFQHDRAVTRIIVRSPA